MASFYWKAVNVRRGVKVEQCGHKHKSKHLALQCAIKHGKKWQVAMFDNYPEPRG